MDITILSLFPDYFKSPFDASIIGQARKRGVLNINLVDIRLYAENRHRRVDDHSYGGGPGMVMMAQPIAAALRDVKKEGSHVVYLSPQGTLLTAAKCRELASHEALVLLCGHYEGVDERILESEVDEEISIGDYVLTNGCLAAIVLVDAMARFVEGVIGDKQAAELDSFEQGILDYPHYTKPAFFEGMAVPEVLLSGNHQKIAKWRKEKAMERTRTRRPDLQQDNK
jgi:tRNA (guanine37-N1)-methyltransferase